jgi:hypothetical protein
MKVSEAAKLWLEYHKCHSKDYWGMYNEARNWHERLFVYFLASPMLIRAGLSGLIAIMATAGFACVSAIYGGERDALETIRKMLSDFYEFVCRVINFFM